MESTYTIIFLASCIPFGLYACYRVTKAHRNDVRYNHKLKR